MNNKKYLDDYLDKFAERCFDNAVDISNSEECICFYCGNKFKSSLVTRWDEDDAMLNGLCPYCGLNTLIPLLPNEEINSDIESELKTRYFGINSDKYSVIKHKIFIKKYEIENIPNTSKTEALYIQSLVNLARIGYEEAYYKLGLLYKWGTEFTNKDPEVAVSYFSNPHLKSNGAAICEIGEMCINGDLNKKDYQNAYNLFAKGMSVNSIISNIRFLDFYLSGDYVEFDADFAYKGYTFLWNGLFNEFLDSLGLEGKALPVLAQRLALCYFYGYGVSINYKKALTFILIAESTLQHVYATTGIFPQNRYDSAINEINKLKNMILSNIKLDETEFENEIFHNAMFLFNENDVCQYDSLQSIDIKQFDKEKGTLDFVTSINKPVLYLDLSKQKCLCIIGPISWKFNNVEEIIYKDFRVEYNSIIYDAARKCYSFTVVDKNLSEEVLTIYFKDIE